MQVWGIFNPLPPALAGLSQGNGGCSHPCGARGPDPDPNPAFPHGWGHRAVDGHGFPTAHTNRKILKVSGFCHLHRVDIAKGGEKEREGYQQAKQHWKFLSWGRQALQNATGNSSRSQHLFSISVFLEICSRSMGVWGSLTSDIFPLKYNLSDRQERPNTLHLFQGSPLHRENNY